MRRARRLKERRSDRQLQIRGGEKRQKRMARNDSRTRACIQVKRGDGSGFAWGLVVMGKKTVLALHSRVGRAVSTVKGPGFCRASSGQPLARPGPQKCKCVPLENLHTSCKKVDGCQLRYWVAVNLGVGLSHDRCTIPAKQLSVRSKTI